ncbi:MAG TPA: GTPase ObgE, partial [Azonexus sp.]|nr:GTPase ObgE [Azonexus sp.]
LAAKPRWLVLNKVDLIPADEREAALAAFIEGYRKATGYDGPCFPIAAISGDGTKPLIFAVYEALEQLARPTPQEKPPEDDIADDAPGGAGVGE